MKKLADDWDEEDEEEQEKKRVEEETQQPAAGELKRFLLKFLLTNWLFLKFSHTKNIFV